MNPEALLHKYYDAEPALLQILLTHSRAVAERALKICDAHPEMDLDRAFVYEAAMLHDIGIRLCDAPGIECHGSEPYLLHGRLGGEILRREGLPRHARVAERHTGTGLEGWKPESQEEQLICYADKFYSKSNLKKVKTKEEAERSLMKFGQEGVDIFRAWAQRFEGC